MGSLGTGSGVQCSQGNDKWVCMLNVCYVCVHLPSSIRHFATPWTIWTLAHQAPLSMEFSRQKYWSRLPFPTPGNLPDSGIKALSLASPALAAGFFTTVPPGKLNMWLLTPQCFLFLFFSFVFLFFPLLFLFLNSRQPNHTSHTEYWSVLWRTQMVAEIAFYMLPFGVPRAKVWFTSLSLHPKTY